MSSPDSAAVYRSVLERLTGLASTLDAGQLATVVPTCPAWTVQDVYAHLTGLADDILRGKVAYPVEHAATAAQVDMRRGRAIGEIVAEWRSYAPALEEVITALGRVGGVVAGDAWTHDQDIHNALGIVSGRTGEGVDLMLLGAWRLKRTLREAGVPPLRVISGDVDWVLGDTDPAATLRIDPYELARALLGRRSVAQMRSYDWEGDPSPYLAFIPSFPPPDTDIVE